MSNSSSTSQSSSLHGSTSLSSSSTHSTQSSQSREFGRLESGEHIYAFTLTNSGADGIEVELINYGGILTKLIQPDSAGVKKNVLLGYEDEIQQWVNGKPWFNSLVGRVANRIGEGKFRLNGREYELEQNNGRNHLHGGENGFNRKVMNAKSIDGNEASQPFVGVAMSFVSGDGENGFPGELHCQVIYKLFTDNTLQMEFHAELAPESDKSTIVNMCNHSYWNLRGDVTNDSTILDHQLFVNADSITELRSDGSMLPTGRIIPVEGSPFDFTQTRSIDSRLGELNRSIPSPGGYDHNFVLNKGEKGLSHPLPNSSQFASLAARLTDPLTGRVMEVFTTQPGLQCYTGNFLDGQSIRGRNGVQYSKHAAICLETQLFPDYLSHASNTEFGRYPSNILKPGEKYLAITQHKFSTTNTKNGKEQQQSK